MSESEVGANPNKCEECGTNRWKYRCPGCSILTCSLPCVKAHKKRTSCSGLKDRSNIVPISQFDHNLLLSDYVFLEDTKRVADVARRVRGRIKVNNPYGNGNGNGRLPNNLHALRNAAYRRRMRLLILPNGMSRRDLNRSRYDTRSDSIFWTIEWRFHSTKVVLIDHNVKECTSINYVIGKHLKPSPWNHPLKAFCNEDIENLKFFIPKSPKGSKTVFRELNPMIPFGQQLAGVGLLEYPVVYVHLPSETYNFEVEKDEKRLHVYEKPQEKRETTPTPKGIVFREEEIEDDSAPDTQVLDFMDYLNTTDREAFLSDMLTSKEAIQSLQSAAGCEELEHATRANGSANATMVCDFNFEQGLKDAYSDLMREVNPDDFLCFDGLYSDNEETRVKDGCNGDLEEELEEGEIPNY